MKALRLSPSVSITLGLVSITMLMFFLLDSLVGIVPDTQSQVRVVREKVSTSLAIQLGSLIKNGDTRVLGDTLSAIQSRDDEIISLAIRLKNGELVAQSGHHRKHWTPPPSGRSTLNHVQVPVHKGQNVWGNIEISYKPQQKQTFVEIVTQPSLALPLTTLFGGFLLYYLYLRRVLNHLDPTRVIPSRVNAALDTLTEGVMILDNNETIMLVNEAFQSLHPNAGDAKMGAKAKDIKWLTDAFDNENRVHPWNPVLSDGKTVSYSQIQLHVTDNDARYASINAAPVLDAKKKVRGCLITFSDVSEQVQMNLQMKRTLTALHQSQSHVEEQNRELQRLANYDQLSGMLNRRAFFEFGDKQFALCQSTNMPLVCLMCDIDHFKLINDNYGHAVGDAAIRSVSGIIKQCIRQNDVLGRYGGEEFCIVFPGLSVELGLERAELIRHEIEEKAGKGVRSVDGLKITSSFGLSILSPSSDSLPTLIDQADQALYVSKESGRNRVSQYHDKVTS